jgi:hypothetical protein
VEQVRDQQPNQEELRQQIEQKRLLMQRLQQEFEQQQQQQQHKQKQGELEVEWHQRHTQPASDGTPSVEMQPARTSGSSARRAGTPAKEAQAADHATPPAQAAAAAADVPADQGAVAPAASGSLAAGADLKDYDHADTSAAKDDGSATIASVTVGGGGSTLASGTPEHSLQTLQQQQQQQQRDAEMESLQLRQQEAAITRSFEMSLRSLPSTRSRNVYCTLYDNRYNVRLFSVISAFFHMNRCMTRHFIHGPPLPAEANGRTNCACSSTLCRCLARPLPLRCAPASFSLPRAPPLVLDEETAHR